MRKIRIIGAAISLTLILGACSSQIQAKTTPTTIEATTVVETEEVTTEASIEESTEEEMHNQILDVLREEVKTGKLTEGEIDDTVPILCYFLDEGKQKEFISELHSLVSNEKEVVQETQPAKQPKETKPATQPTKSVVQPTQPQPTEPVVTQPQPQATEPVTQPEVQPTQPQQSETHYEAGTTMKDANGNEVHKGKLSDSQTLSPEENAAINNIEFN